MACLDAQCNSCGEIWFSNDCMELLNCPKCGEPNYRATHDEFGPFSLEKYHKIKKGGGEIIMSPRKPLTIDIIEQRKQKIIEDYYSGIKSLFQIAIKNKSSVGRVSKILSEYTDYKPKRKNKYKAKYRRNKHKRVYKETYQKVYSSNSSVTIKDLFLCIANNNYDGHYSIFKFTTNYRCMFGTPYSRTDIENAVEGKTEEEAMMNALLKNVKEVK